MNDFVNKNNFCKQDLGKAVIIERENFKFLIVRCLRVEIIEIRIRGKLLELAYHEYRLASSSEQLRKKLRNLKNIIFRCVKLSNCVTDELQNMKCL